MPVLTTLPGIMAAVTCSILAACPAIDLLITRKNPEKAQKTVAITKPPTPATAIKIAPIEGLKKACGEAVKTTYCTACYTGKYPTNWVDAEEIQPATMIAKT